MVFIIDTNAILDVGLEEVILSQPKACRIIIPIYVLEELDKFKNGTENIAANCRASIRLLDEISQTGNIIEGVDYKGRIIQVYNDGTIDLSKTDNKIIMLAKQLTDAGEDTTIITRDIHERIIANAFGLNAKDHQQVKPSSIYDCIKTIKITDKQANQLATDGYIDTKKKLPANQFVCMKDSLGGIQYGIYKQHDHRIYPIKTYCTAWNIKPKKKDGNILIEQAMYLNLLLDPTVQFISCIGTSGTGKTFLALAAGLEQILKSDQYKKMVVLRPLVAVGADIGYLPGDKNAKLENWMGSTFDNLEALLEHYDTKDGMYVNSRDKIYELINQNMLELEAMTYIRGRTLPNQFIIVDDAQNLTIQQAVTIITRMGEGSKLIFIGDISKQQIDNPKLSPANNGLTYVIERLRGMSDIIGHVVLTSTVRSELADIAVKKL